MVKDVAIADLMKQKTKRNCAGKTKCKKKEPGKFVPRDLGKVVSSGAGGAHAMCFE